jgi:hypothetical protein
VPRLRIGLIIQNIESQRGLQRYPHTDVGRGAGRSFACGTSVLGGEAVVLATVPCPYLRAVARKGTAPFIGNEDCPPPLLMHLHAALL